MASEFILSLIEDTLSVGRMVYSYKRKTNI